LAFNEHKLSSRGSQAVGGSPATTTVVSATLERRSSRCPMGIVHALCQTKSYKDEYVASGSHWHRGAPNDDGVGEVRMIICALNYRGLGVGELKATVDGDMMQELARACGVTDVTCLYEEQATLGNIRSAIQQVGSRTGPDDYFVFFFSGHGVSIPDDDGDESDGMDEAFVTYAPRGAPDWTYRDDDFAEDITSTVSAGARVLIIADCCHSGTIADLSSHHVWDGLEAISISGCEDHLVSEDSGRGGILTLAMLYAIEALQDLQAPYSVGKLFNATLKEDEMVFSSEQSLQLNCSRWVAPDTMAWPLLPLSRFESKTSRLSHALAGRKGINALAALGL